jgi:hypothetical protein
MLPRLGLPARFFVLMRRAPALATVGGAWSQALDLTTEIARLRARLAANSAQEQHCLAGATQPVWTASVATDLCFSDPRQSGGRRGPSASSGGARAQGRDARARTTPTRTGRALPDQQIRLDCLDRADRERRPPSGRGGRPRRVRRLVSEARAHGTARLRQDLVRLQERSRALSAHWKLSQADAGAGAQALKAEMADLRRRNTAALEGDPARVMADPTFRAAEALVATAEAWDRERTAGGRLSAARNDAERRKTLMERDEAARQAREYWATAERLLGRGVPEGTASRGTASPGAGGTP